jgi:hypothetical protein
VYSIGLSCVLPRPKRRRITGTGCYAWLQKEAQKNALLRMPTRTGCILHSVMTQFQHAASTTMAMQAYAQMSYRACQLGPTVSYIHSLTTQLQHAQSRQLGHRREAFLHAGFSARENSVSESPTCASSRRSAGGPLDEPRWHVRDVELGVQARQTRVDLLHRRVIRARQLAQDLVLRPMSVSAEPLHIYSVSRATARNVNGATDLEAPGPRQARHVRCGALPLVARRAAGRISERRPSRLRDQLQQRPARGVVKEAIQHHRVAASAHTPTAPTFGRPSFARCGGRSSRPSTSPLTAEPCRCPDL